MLASFYKTGLWWTATEGDGSEEGCRCDKYGFGKYVSPPRGNETQDQLVTCTNKTYMHQMFPLPDDYRVNLPDVMTMSTWLQIVDIVTKCPVHEIQAGCMLKNDRSCILYLGMFGTQRLYLIKNVSDYMISCSGFVKTRVSDRDMCVCMLRNM